MPDLENRMPDLLQDLAREARTAPALERRVLRRSRRRRVANVALAGLAVVAVVVAGFVLAGALGTGGHSSPADGSSTPALSEVAPTPLLAIWPETDERTLAFAQAEADLGALDWRLDPTTTAERYAIDQLGWDPADVRVQGTASDPESGITTATIVNARYDNGVSTVPQTVLSMRQLGVTGDEGVWSVIGADTDLIVPGTDQSGEWPTSATAGSQLELNGSRIGEGGEWTLVVSIETFSPTDESGTSSSATSSGSGMSSLQGSQSGPFSESVGIPKDATGTVVVSVEIADAKGQIAALDSFPVAVEPSAASTAGASPVDAIWPEATQEALDEAQAQADAGALPWRLDPVETAAAFATQVLGWDPANVVTGPAAHPESDMTVMTVQVSNQGLGPGADSAGPPAPPTYVTLEQLGTTGDTAVWSVTAADSPLIEVDPTVREPGTGPIFSGRLDTATAEWTPAVWAVDATGRRTEGDRGYSGSASGDGRTFRVWMEVPPEIVPVTGVLIGLFDPEGTIVAVDAFPYRWDQPTVDEPPGAGGVGPSGATGPSGALGGA